MGGPVFCLLISFRLRKQFPGTFAKRQTTRQMTHYQPKSPRFWRCVMRYTVFKIAHVWEFPVQTLWHINEKSTFSTHASLWAFTGQAVKTTEIVCLRELAGLPLEDAGLWLPEVCTCLPSPVSLSAHLM